MLNLLNNPLVFLIYAASLVIAITIHEFAHAWTANHLGDPTPKLQDRLNLNPLSHLDPLGTLALLIAGFGWGKPVQFDPYNLKNPKTDTILISLAGPASNLILAILVSILLRLPIPGVVGAFLAPLLVYNVVIAIFNLIPIHPLDGGKILVGLLPNHLSHDVDVFLHQYGIILLLLIIFPFFGGTPLASRFMNPIVDAILQILSPLHSSFI